MSAARMGTSADGPDLPAPSHDGTAENSSLERLSIRELLERLAEVEAQLRDATHRDARPWAPEVDDSPEAARHLEIVSALAREEVALIRELRTRDVSAP